MCELTMRPPAWLVKDLFSRRDGECLLLYIVPEKHRQVRTGSVHFKIHLIRRVSVADLC